MKCESKRYIKVFVILCVIWYHLCNKKCEKREKHPWRGATFSSSTLQHATLPNVSLLHGTKLRKASHLTHP